ncbi:MAG: hydroxymethylbilane synthase [Betaproteobacteria bacterium]|nr:hydroxymethylbilane synthase [Betaproteobacteria bacterium]
MNSRFVIGTRRSRLALWQAEHVKARLEALHAGLRVELLPLTTRGDELLEATLAQAGGKGLFVKELEAALADGRADLLVHSMKDMPVELPEDFTLAAITARGDARDVFVSGRYTTIAELPAGSVLGTSSLRRQAQILERFPALTVRPLRGNLDTRLAKLDRGEYAGIVLAAAGLERLGLSARVRSVLTVEESLPAAGQAALGIECLSARADVLALVAPLADRATTACVRAERAVNRALGGNCAIPLGAYAELHGSTIGLRALVASPDGRRIARAEAEGDVSAPESLGQRVAERLRQRGAAEILAGLSP